MDVFIFDWIQLHSWWIFQLAILVLDPWIQENIHLLVAKSLSRK